MNRFFIKKVIYPVLLIVISIIVAVFLISELFDNEKIIVANSYDGLISFELATIQVDSYQSSSSEGVLFEVDDTEKFIEKYVIQNEYYIGIYHEYPPYSSNDAVLVYYFLYEGYHFYIKAYEEEVIVFECVLAEISTELGNYYIPFIIDEYFSVSSEVQSIDFVYNLDEIDEFSTFDDLVGFYNTTNTDYFYIDYENEDIYLKAFDKYNDFKPTDNYIFKLDFAYSGIVVECVDKQS